MPYSIQLFYHGARKVTPTSWWATFLTVVLLVTLGACGGSDSLPLPTPIPPAPTCVPSATSSCIGTSGGKVSGPHGAEIIIPAGALTADVAISVQPDTSAGSPLLPSGTSAAGLVWQLLPHNRDFAVPVTITLPFDPTALAPGAVPSLYKAQPGGTYALIAPTTVNGNFISAQVSSFSYVAIRTNKSPVAMLTMPAGNAEVNQVLSFSSSGSTDVEGAIAQYIWNFGDGSTPQEGANLTTVTHSFTTLGDYNVSLTVIDALGATNIATASIKINPACTPKQVLINGACDASPVASFATNNTTPLNMQEVVLDPSASQDPDGTIVKYEWSFSDGTQPIINIAPTVLYKNWTSAGTQTVNLTVTDNLGATNHYAQVFNVTAFAPTGVLNDTGIDWCGDANNNNILCSLFDWSLNLWGAVQDAYYGRDAQAKSASFVKIGAGMAGFDFTKLGSDGKPLPIQNATWLYAGNVDAGNESAGTLWDCVRDNTTGLIWEVKRKDAAHLRHLDHTYTWYNTDTNNNGGHPGTQNSNTCTGVPNTSQCNTQSYVDAVNTQPAGYSLCGFRDWRLPSVDELRNLAHTGVPSVPSLPYIDTHYFPNTSFSSDPFLDGYWTSSPFASDSSSAWIVFFNLGHDGNGSNKGAPARVRLVRSGL